MMRSKFCCDTVKKEFGKIDSKGSVEKSKLKPMFQVDDQIVNPEKRYEFIIMKD